jgi:C_GCAxxG_C_C family probable redox protein
MNNIQIAEERFLEEYACSQAIFSTYSEKFDIDPEIALSLSAGFGGGMCMGKTCGAVTGAIMVLGLAFGGHESETSAGRKNIKEAIIKFTDRYKDLNGSTECNELLSVDISTPEGFKVAMDKNLFKTICPKFIKDSVTIIEEIMNKKIIKRFIIE